MVIMEVEVLMFLLYSDQVNWDPWAKKRNIFQVLQTFNMQQDTNKFRVAE